VDDAGRGIGKGGVDDGVLFRHCHFRLLDYKIGVPDQILVELEGRGADEWDVGRDNGGLYGRNAAAYVSLGTLWCVGYMDWASKKVNRGKLTSK
jgi:hypothetical protein